jgi:hypothetical protein
MPRTIEPRAYRSTENVAPLTKRNTGTANGAGKYPEPEQPDTDRQAGSGQLPTHNPPPGRGADFPKGGSR